MAIKRINFDRSLAYYRKDKDSYVNSECHVNVYQRFYRANYEEVEKRDYKIRYVTGLLIGDSKDERICYIHSWIEINNEVIDVTTMANYYNRVNPDPTPEELEAFKEDVVKTTKYMPIKPISDIEFTRLVQKMARENGVENIPKNLENYILGIITGIENDKALKEKQEKAGYRFVEEYNN